MDFKDKKIGLLGFGVENQALFAWLVKNGAKCITICDTNEKLKAKNEKPKLKIKNINFKLGKDYLKKLEDFNVVFRTPGISPKLPDLVRAKKKGVEISSQIKLFMDLCPAKTIGITGTKGKGTTSTLIYKILINSLRNSRSEAAFSTGTRSHPTLASLGTATRSGGIPLSKQNIYLGGNIGNAPIEFLDKLTKNDIVVLELSSFQLQDLNKSPNIAVVLDIKEDHLDFHKNRAEYVRAKENIVRFQSKNDFSVINLDYLTSFKFAAVSASKNDYYFSRRKSVDLGTYIEWTPKGGGAHFGKIILRTEKNEYEICKTYDITLRGEHNLENICAAITASYLAGASIESIKKEVPKFPGLEHRLEFAGEKRGVKFYNDSFSTTPDTAIAAINSFSEPIVLIAGGSEKGADYTELGKTIANSPVKNLIAIGITGPKIIKSLKQYNNITPRKYSGQAKKQIIIKNCKNMEEIIKAAKKGSKSGDVVLLSPASASFGMFKNYKDRGNQFKKEVSKLL